MKKLDNILFMFFALGALAFFVAFIYYKDFAHCPMYLSVIFTVTMLPRILLGFFLGADEIDDSVWLALLKLAFFYYALVFIFGWFYPVDYWYSPLIRFGVFITFFALGFLYSIARNVEKEKETDANEETKEAD